MKKYLLSFAVMAMGATLLTGCLGDDSNGSNTPTEIVVTKGALVVNNGSSYQSIDGSLTFFDAMSGATEADIYKKVNGKSLGGTPNDVLVYGQKVYVVGSDENTIFDASSHIFQKIGTLLHLYLDHLIDLSIVYSIVHVICLHRLADVHR